MMSTNTYAAVRNRTKVGVFLLGILAALLLFRCQEEEVLATGEAETDTVVHDLDPDSALARIIFGEDRTDEEALRIAHTVRATSEWFGVDPRIVANVLYIESRGDSAAVGPDITVRVRGRLVRTNAIGLGQVVPEFWLGVFPECGQDLTRVRDNVCNSVRIWQHYRDRFDGDLGTALLAYNGCYSDDCAWYADHVLRALD